MADEEFMIGKYRADYSALPEDGFPDDPALVELYANSNFVSAVLMPRELTDEQADAAMRATAVHLDIKGSQLTVNREKMKARYRSLVKFIEASR